MTKPITGPISADEQSLHDYVRRTAGVDLQPASLKRVSRGCDTAAAALQAVCTTSLFDSEPEQLHSVLEALADDDSSHA